MSHPPALSAAESAAPDRWRIIASYLTLNIASGTVAGAMQIAVPLYALSLKAGTAQIGLLRGISGVGMLLLVIPAGFLVDHFGSKRLFLTGGILGTLATWSLVYAQTPAMLTVVLGVAGLFASLKMTALNSSFFSNLKAIGIDKAGWFKGSMSIGLTFIGPVLGGLLAQTWPYDTVFRLLAAMTLIPITLVLFFHPDYKRPAAGGLMETLRRQLAEFRALLRDQSLHLLLATESLSTAFFATFSAFSVVLAVQGLHQPATKASLLLTVEGGVFILTVFLAGPLIKVLSRLRLYLLSTAVSIIGISGLVLAGNYPWLLAATAVLGVGLGLTNLVTSSRIGQMQGEKGKIVGLFAAAVGVGASLGPMIGGLIGTWFGTRSIFLAFVPLFVLLAAIMWRQENGPSPAPALIPEGLKPSVEAD